MGRKNRSIPTKDSNRTLSKNIDSSHNKTLLKKSDDSTKKLNSNAQCFDRPRHPNTQSLSRWKMRNDSSQIKEAFTENQPQAPSRYSDNVKNQSNIKPSCLSVTYLESNIHKPIASKSVLIENPKPYKPPLVELDPEYLTTAPIEVKNIKDFKDINRKYSTLLHKRKTKLFDKSKKFKLSPLKLCDESKLTKAIINKVKPIRKAHSISSNITNQTKCSENEENSYCDDRKNKCSVNNCPSCESILNGARFRKIMAEANENVFDGLSHQKSIRPRDTDIGTDFLANKHNSHCKKRIISDLFHQRNAQNISFQDNINYKPKTDICTDEQNNSILSDSDSITNDCSDYSEESNYPCKGCPCPLHNVVLYRQQNFAETHHVSPTNNSKPCNKSYFLDDRLFPVRLREPALTDPEALVQNKISKPVVTLNSKQKEKILPGVSVLKSNHLTDDIDRNKMSHLFQAPTNSLALKYQKGVG